MVDIDREKFCVPGPGPYLLTHSVGCLPRAAAETLQSRFLEPWMQHGGDAWPAWLQILDGFRAALATLLGGSAAEYCPQQNVSSGLSKVLGALPRPKSERRVWLAAEDSFPSLGFVLQRAARLGYELRFIPRSRNPGELSTWLEALTPDVCGALVTHVHSNTGVLAPAAAIARVCAQREVFCAVDVAQSAGIIPFSVDELGADVVVGSCIKWLCGGPGAGFLWIRPSRLAALEPLDVGWFSHADPFEFDIHSFVPALDARRFLGGSPSPAPLAIATASLRLIAKLGVATIRERNLALSDAFVTALPQRWRPSVPRVGIGGTLCIPAGAAHAQVESALAAAGARCDSRGSTIRLSFHVCNTLEEARLIARAWPEEA